MPEPMTYTQLWHYLTPLYETGEAKAIVRLLLESCFDMSMADMLCGGLSRLDDHRRKELSAMMDLLRDGMPVQYVTGRADFMGRVWHVAPGVLIPRPETEVLCQWVIDDCEGRDVRVVDIGCGSGCIAVSLALGISRAHVEAWDISPKAIEVTRRNAAALGADVEVINRDVLDDDQCAVCSEADVVVSNPPYVCRSEMSDMHVNVVRFEPEEALFVPNEDPLLFYPAIIRRAFRMLRQGGKLYFECNPKYVSEVGMMMERMGFHAVTYRDDQFGRRRFVMGKRDDKS